MKIFLKSLLIIIMFLFAVELPSLAQTSITGKVVDAVTKEPLPFANVVVSGQTKGTVSNLDGIYVLNLDGLTPNDQVNFSYMGYETRSVKVETLRSQSRVDLQQATFNLQEIQVLSRNLTALDIIALIEKNFEANYPQVNEKQQIFYHKYERTPFPKENKVVLKKTNFIGMDKATFNDIFKLIPDEFVEYHDVILDRYCQGDQQKMMPVEALSLEEGSQKQLIQQVEARLGDFFKDIEKTKTEEDVYYKFRTGIFAFKDKSDYKPDSSSKFENDSLSFSLPLDGLKWAIQNLFKSYAHIDSDNWEFINSPSKYEYEMQDMTVFNDEWVYHISFVPKKRGLFMGDMYVSAKTYAILQLDFEFAKGKQSEKVQMLGFGHAINYRKGRITFEKGEKGYAVKYINAQQRESASIDRDFSIMKKQKRFLIDKELNEIKFETELSFNINSSWELLVMDRQPLTSLAFENIKQPAKIKFKKQYAYSPEMWTNRSGIAPSSELKKYIRK